MSSLVAGLLAATLVIVAPTLVGAGPAPRFVIARATGNATVLYDASADVADIVRDRLADDAANHLLQLDALRVLKLAEPELPNAQTITVRITYARSGDVSPVYGTPTFAGVERYANLTATGIDARADRDRWKERDGDASLPTWISFTIVGQLPPR